MGEYEEWGNPEVAEQFAWMRAYDPYTNLKRGRYPAMLVRTSLNDSQVMYWEPAKYVARLRLLKEDTNPLLFLTNMGAGHGGASGRLRPAPGNRGGLRLHPRGVGCCGGARNSLSPRSMN